MLFNVGKWLCSVCVCVNGTLFLLCKINYLKLDKHSVAVCVLRAEICCHSGSPIHVVGFNSMSLAHNIAHNFPDERRTPQWVMIIICSQPRT